MKLPNSDRVTADIRKLTQYALNPEHDDGRHKAHLFQKLLGIGVEHAEELRIALLNAAAQGEALVGRQDQYGQRYTVDFEFTGPKGREMIRSVWIVRKQESFPDLVTCYIL